MDASVSLGRPSLFQDVKTVTYLKQEVLPVLLARAQEQPRELRLWLVLFVLEAGPSAVV